MDTTETRRKAIFETLRSEIRSGKFVSSEKFPSETALARRFACSRQTVVHAMMSLEDLGLVRRQRGAGTFLTKKARRFGSSIGLIIPGIGCGEIFPPIFREISRLAQTVGIPVVLIDCDVVASPPLTTIHQPCEAIAATAFDRLLARIDAPDPPPRECLLPAPLVVRASTQSILRKKIR